MDREIVKYKLSLTAGGLLINEFRAVLSNITDFKNFRIQLNELNYSVIPTNSESAQKRYFLEVSRRIKEVENIEIWTEFLDKNEREQKIILLYVFCKNYKLFTDFMFTTVLVKWSNMNYTIEPYDFEQFLYRQADFHPELLKASKITWYKLGQVSMKILSDVGLIKDGKLSRVECDHALLRSIISSGDIWFLDILLNNKTEKEEILTC